MLKIMQWAFFFLQLIALPINLVKILKHDFDIHVLKSEVNFDLREEHKHTHTQSHYCILFSKPNYVTLYVKESMCVNKKKMDINKAEHFHFSYHFVIIYDFFTNEIFTANFVNINF